MFAKKFLAIICMVFAAMSCSDELTPTFSRKYPVRCDLLCFQYVELVNLVGNYGQFVSIRQSGTDIVIQGQRYTLSAEQGRYFTLGLGGLIVGANSNSDLRAYDLACPNCDRADRRLNIDEFSMARCPGPNCRIVYNLNKDGAIEEKPEGCVHSKPRGLYRYNITYDGQNLHIFN